MTAALRLALSLALTLAGVQALAQEATEEAIVALTINGEPAPQPLLVRRDADGTLLLRSADLASLRLQAPAAGGTVIDGETYFPLDTTFGAQVAFNAATQTAEITLPPTAFTTTRASAFDGAATREIASSIGGFVNYDLYAQATEETVAGAIVEGGLFGRLGVATSSWLGRDEPGAREAVRLDTIWTRDFPDRIATLRVGDAISASGAWGRSVRFGGVQFGTNFATQPTLVKTPLLSAEGEAIVPSTVDVFVNGQRRASEAVPPGPFAIENVPAINGAGQMQVVITDALGRQQVISQPYYSGAALLRAGLTEFSVEAGAIREDYALRSDAYGDFVVSATYRHGYSDRLTAEFHGEGESGGAAAVGVDTAFLLGNAGVATATLAGGGDSEGLGWLGGLGFEHARDRYNLFARTQYATRSFAQLGTTIERQRPKARVFAGMGHDLARYGSLQFAYGLQSYWADPTMQTFGLSHSLSLGARGFLNFSATYSHGEDDHTDLLLSWTLPIGQRRTVSSGLEYRPDREYGDAFVAVASIQQSLPRGQGFGYVASVATNEEYQLGSSYQGHAGRIGAEYARRGSQDGLRFDATGGLAITSAGVMASRRLDQSFAVVKVADYAGLTVYVENQPVARTDEEGRVLLDSLRAYEDNSISIDPKELPMDAALAKASMTVVPAHRSGALLRFPVSRVRAATLRLVQPDGAPVPAGALVEIGDATLPVALDGLVYVENLPSVSRARAQWPGHRCEFMLPAGETAEAQADLGTIRCEPDAP